MLDKEDIIEDIFKVEGIRPNLDALPEGIKFFTKYSEHFNKQISPNSSMSDLNERIEFYTEIDLSIKDEMLSILIKDLNRKQIKAKLLNSTNLFIISLSLINIGLITYLVFGR